MKYYSRDGTDSTCAYGLTFRFITVVKTQIRVRDQYCTVRYVVEYSKYNTLKQEQETMKKKKNV